MNTTSDLKEELYNLANRSLDWRLVSFLRGLKWGWELYLETHNRATKYFCLIGGFLLYIVYGQRRLLMHLLHSRWPTTFLAVYGEKWALGGGGNYQLMVATFVRGQLVLSAFCDNWAVFHSNQLFFFICPRSRKNSMNYGEVIFPNHLMYIDDGDNNSNNGGGAEGGNYEDGDDFPESPDAHLTAGAGKNRSFPSVFPVFVASCIILLKKIFASV